MPKTPRLKGAKGGAECLGNLDLTEEAGKCQDRLVQGLIVTLGKLILRAHVALFLTVIRGRVGLNPAFPALGAHQDRGSQGTQPVRRPISIKASCLGHALAFL